MACTVFGVNSNWWSFVGIAIEIAGFVFLFSISINDVMGKFFDLVVGNIMLNANEIKTKQDLIASHNIWRVITRDARIKLYVGGSVVLFSMALQLVGSWPC